MIKQFISLLMAMLVLANTAAGADEYCWKQTKTRGAGTIPTDCSYDQQKQGLLCYPKCKAGFSGVASVCWQDCPAGYVDDGAFCRKGGSYGRGVGYAWQVQDGVSSAGMLARCQASSGGTCEMWGAIAYPTCKAGYYAAGANVCAQSCPPGMTDMGVSCTKQTFMRATISGQCPAGKTYEDGLCYDPCAAGFTGTGPVCGQKCPANLPYSCGAGCSKDYEACVVTTSDQVMNVLSVVTDVAMAIVTLGGSYGAKVAAKSATQTAAEQGIKAATKAALKELTQNISKNLTKEVFIATLKREVRSLSEDTILNLWETLSIQGSNAFMAQLEGETPADFDFYSLDPTGIASVVKAYNHATCPAPPAGGPYAVVPGIPALPPSGIDPGLPWTLAGGQLGVVDIAAGEDGTLWAVTDQQQVVRLKPGQKVLETVSRAGLPGTALLRVAANNGASAWVVTGTPGGYSGDIYHFEGAAWKKVPGAATDIAVDKFGNLYAIGGGETLWKLAAGEEVWTALPALPAGAKPSRIGAGGVEQVWVITVDHKDFKWVGPNAAQPSLSVWAAGGTSSSTKTDVAVAADGSAWFASGNGNVMVNRAGATTQLPQVVQGAFPTNIAMGGNGRAFALATRQIFKYSGNK